MFGPTVRDIVWTMASNSLCKRTTTLISSKTDYTRKHWLTLTQKIVGNIGAMSSPKLKCLWSIYIGWRIDCTFLSLESGRWNISLVSMDMLAFPEIFRTSRPTRYELAPRGKQRHAEILIAFQYAVSTHPAAGHSFKNTRYKPRFFSKICYLFCWARVINIRAGIVYSLTS